MIQLKDAAKKGLIDFHTHSTASDGGDTPTQLVERAFEKGVSALALTDHNVITGLPEFTWACKSKGIFSIPFGVEIYASLPDNLVTLTDNGSPDLIILGKNPSNLSSFFEYQFQLSAYREREWLPGTIESLRQFGFEIPPFDLKEQLVDLGMPPVLHDVITFGNNLSRLVDYVLSLEPIVKQEAVLSKPITFMNRYIYSTGKPAYKRRIAGFNVEDAVNLAKTMNCKVFIAHPGGEYGFLSEKILEYYVQCHVHGIEVRNYFNTPNQNKNFDKFARKKKLLRAGGSDCHGENGPFKIGMYDRPTNQLSKEVLEELWGNLS